VKRLTPSNEIDTFDLWCQRRRRQPVAVDEESAARLFVRCRSRSSIRRAPRHRWRQSPWCRTECRAANRGRSATKFKIALEFGLRWASSSLQSTLARSPSKSCRSTRDLRHRRARRITIPIPRTTTPSPISSARALIPNSRSLCNAHNPTGSPPRSRLHRIAACRPA